MNIYDYATFKTEEDGKVTKCIIHINGKGVFTGYAICHEDDADMKSELTGKHISYQRAYIKYLKYCSRCEVKPALAALKQLYYSMNKSKYYNDSSYEVKMLKAQMAMKETELDLINEEIRIAETDLDSYIKVKEEKYKLIRAWREGSETLKARTE